MIDGFTLLMVVVAVAITLGALAAIGWNETRTRNECEICHAEFTDARDAIVHTQEYLPGCSCQRCPGQQLHHPSCLKRTVAR